MRSVGGVRKSIHHSWLAKGLGLGLPCWGFKGVQEEIPWEEASTLQIGSVAFPPWQYTRPQLHPCHRLFDQNGHQDSSSPSQKSRACSLWLLVIPYAQRLSLWDNWGDERGCDEGHWHDRFQYSQLFVGFLSPSVLILSCFAVSIPSKRYRFPLFNIRMAQFSLPNYLTLYWVYSLNVCTMDSNSFSFLANSLMSTKYFRWLIFFLRFLKLVSTCAFIKYVNHRYHCYYKYWCW